MGVFSLAIFAENRLLDSYQHQHQHPHQHPPNTPGALRCAVTNRAREEQQSRQINRPRITGGKIPVATWLSRSDCFQRMNIKPPPFSRQNRRQDIPGDQANKPQFNKPKQEEIVLLTVIKTNKDVHSHLNRALNCHCIYNLDGQSSYKLAIALSLL